MVVNLKTESNGMEPQRKVKAELESWGKKQIFKTEKNLIEERNHIFIKQKKTLLFFCLRKRHPYGKEEANKEKRVPKSGETEVEVGQVLRGRC